MRFLTTRRSFLALVATIITLVATFLPFGPSAAAQTSSGMLYTLTNAAEGNEIAVWQRDASGMLTAMGRVATKGFGTGSGLGSQGAIASSENGDWLFAVNAGSDSISSFDVRRGIPTFISLVPSGGNTPISLTVSENVLFVLNGNGTANITGFTIGQDGSLALIPQSGRILSNYGAGMTPGPAQVQFSPDGRLLVVTEKMTNRIDTYLVDRAGRTSLPSVHVSNGETPFGFAFGKRDQIFVSEAFGGAANRSALSSYSVGSDGALRAISRSVGTTQTSACWVVVTDNQKYVYTANTMSNSITGYRIDAEGGLTLLNVDGRTGVTGDGTRPSDMALSSNSVYLYVLNSGNISAFRVMEDGSLTAVAGVSGLPMSTGGLLAR